MPFHFLLRTPAAQQVPISTPSRTAIREHAHYVEDITAGNSPSPVTKIRAPSDNVLREVVQLSWQCVSETMPNCAMRIPASRPLLVGSIRMWGPGCSLPTDAVRSFGNARHRHCLDLPCFHRAPINLAGPNKVASPPCRYQQGVVHQEAAGQGEAATALPAMQAFIMQNWTDVPLLFPVVSPASGVVIQRQQVKQKLHSLASNSSVRLPDRPLTFPIASFPCSCFSQ